MRAGAVLFLALLAARASAAAADPICADRPGQTTATCTVPAGHWQVETSIADWSLQKGGGDRSTALTLGQATVKFGLTDRSDIAVDVTTWQRDGREQGFGDVSILYKHRLTRDDAPLQLAVLPVVKIPAAKRPLGNGKSEAALLVPIGYAVGNSPFSLSFTPELDWAADSDGHGRHPSMVQVAGVAWQASEKLSLAADLLHQWDWDPQGTTRQASAGGSVACLLRDDVQLDAGANLGLNRVSSDVELYAGVSKRF